MHTNPSGDGAAVAEIRQLLHEWAEATRTGQQEAVLARHAPDVLIYDVLAPLQYHGADAYRRSWDEWQPNTVGPGVFELNELQITAGEDVAYASALIRCGGALPDGRTFEDWVRATFCLRRANGRWLVAHQHISMPRSSS